MREPSLEARPIPPKGMPQVSVSLQVRVFQRLQDGARKLDELRGDDPAPKVARILTKFVADGLAVVAGEDLWEPAAAAPSTPGAVVLEIESDRDRVVRTAATRNGYWLVRELAGAALPKMRVENAVRVIEGCVAAQLLDQSSTGGHVRARGQGPAAMDAPRPAPTPFPMPKHPGQPPREGPRPRASDEGFRPPAPGFMRELRSEVERAPPPPDDELPPEDTTRPPPGDVRPLLIPRAGPTSGKRFAALEQLDETQKRWDAQEEPSVETLEELAYANKCSARRRELGLTQKGLAEKAELKVNGGQSFVSMLEKGRKVPEKIKAKLEVALWGSTTIIVSDDEPPPRAKKPEPAPPLLADPKPPSALATATKPKPPVKLDPRPKTVVVDPVHARPVRGPRGDGAWYWQAAIYHGEKGSYRSVWHGWAMPDDVAKILEDLVVAQGLTVPEKPVPLVRSAERPVEPAAPVVHQPIPPETGQDRTVGAMARALRREPQLEAELEELHGLRSFVEAELDALGVPQVGTIRERMIYLRGAVLGLIERKPT